MIYPVKRPVITSNFGMRTLKGIKKFHSGIDLAPTVQGEKGDVISAVLFGTVMKLGSDPDGYGNYIVLQHLNVCTLYAHLDSFLVKVGQQVRQGQAIGYMGNSGHCVGGGKYGGTHTHFEVREISKYDPNTFFDNEPDGRKYKSVDPLKYLTDEAPPVEPTESELAREFVIMHKISDGENGAGQTTRLQVWVMLYRFYGVIVKLISKN